MEVARTLINFMTSFEQRLRQESAGWVQEGLVSGPQREALLARHPETESSGGGRFVAILGSVGGALLLAGVCLLISANWQEIGDWVKIGGLVALLVGAYGAGWWAKIAPGRYSKTGDAFFMLGAGLFMAGIALVSQIFHLNSRPASGVLIWWLGIVAIPWLVRSKGAQFVSLVAGLTWIGMEMGTHGSWLEIYSQSNGYHSGSELPFVGVYGLLGLALWLAGLGLRTTRHDDFAELHEKLGALLVCVALYLLGFARHQWEWRSQAEFMVLHPLLLAGVLILAGAIFAWRCSRKEVLSLLVWWVIALVPMVALSASIHLNDGGWLWSALAWAGLLVLNIGMIRTGLATGRAGWVNLGIGFIALNIITRYFDLFGTMLQGGIFFVVSGVIVLTLGIYLERKRRGWMAQMRAGKEVL